MRLRHMTRHIILHALMQHKTHATNQTQAIRITLLSLNTCIVKYLTIIRNNICIGITHAYVLIVITNYFQQTTHQQHGRHYH